MGKTWQIRSLDTLFFRDGKPIDPGESTWLDSIFPPSPLTMQGIVRTRILTEFGDNFTHDNLRWNLKPEDTRLEGVDLTEQIGEPCQSKNIGELKLSGPFLVHKGERLYPLPLDVVTDSSNNLSFLKPSKKTVHCDLGKEVFLPCSSERNIKPIDGAYITEDDMKEVLLGKTVPFKNLYFLFEPENFKVSDSQILADREYRVGLARNNKTRTHIDGHLYAISPVRMRENLHLEIDVDDIDPKLQPSPEQKIQKAGGEGKLVDILVVERHEKFEITDMLKEFNPSDESFRFKLVLLNNARFNGKKGWMPDGLKNITGGGWEWKMGGISCKLVSACIGKAQKIGGWDIAKGTPKDMVSYIPAGSVYFFEAKETLKCGIIKTLKLLSSGDKTASGMLKDDIIKTLESLSFGEEAALGYGQFFIGTWSHDIDRRDVNEQEKK